MHIRPAIQLTFRYALAALVVLTAAVLSCSHGGGQIETGAAGEFDLPGFPELSRLAKLPAAKLGLYRDAADYCLELENQSVLVAEPRLYYLPGGQTTFEQCSFAIYQFDLSAESGGHNLVLNWYTAPPTSPVNPQLWLGLSDWGSGSWEWHAPLNPSLLQIEDVAQFAHPDSGSFFVAVVAIGDADCLLTRLGFPNAGLDVFTASGTVTDNTGQPRPLLEMNLSGDAEATTITGPDGVYTFSGLPNGNYQVTPSEGTYEPASHEFAIEGADITGLDFQEPVGGDPPRINLVYYIGPGLYEFTSITYHAGVSGSPPFEYEWDFAGAGTPNTSTAVEPTITLNAAGQYQYATLTVTNQYGSDVLPWVIVVQPTP